MENSQTSLKTLEWSYNTDNQSWDALPWQILYSHWLDAWVIKYPYNHPNYHKAQMIWFDFNKIEEAKNFISGENSVWN